MPSRNGISARPTVHASEAPKLKSSVTSRKMLRRGIAVSLHTTGALGLLRRFEGSHQLQFLPTSKWPRFRKYLGSKFGILCYHRVGTEGTPLFSRLDPKVFDAQMRYIRKHYRLVPLGQLCQEIMNGNSVPPTLAITFDDGYRDLFTYAFPVLRKYGIPATIYLIGRCMQTGESPWYDHIFVALDQTTEGSIEVELDEPRQFTLTTSDSRRKAAWEIVCYLRTITDLRRRTWCREFEERMNPPQERLEGRMLNWHQARSMQTEGICFGAHTMTHPSVAQVEAVNLEEELNTSRRLLEAGLDAPVVDFAYPFGKPSDCLSEGNEALVQCGYRSAVTTVDGINFTAANLMRLRRMQIGDDPSVSLFAFNLVRIFFEGVPQGSALPVATRPDAYGSETGGRVS